MLLAGAHVQKDDVIAIRHAALQRCGRDLATKRPIQPVLRVTAHRARRVGIDRNGSRVHRSEVHKQQPTTQGLTRVCKPLDRLRGLDDAEQPRDDAEHATGRAVGDKPGGRRGGEQATVAGASVDGEQRRLSRQLVDGSERHRDAQVDTRVVDGVAGEERVRAVHHHVRALEKLHRVVAPQPIHDGNDDDVGVLALERRRRRLSLPRPEIPGAVQELTVQVRLFDAIRVDNRQSADSRSGQVERGRTAQPSGADDDHVTVAEAGLALAPDFREHHLPGIPEIAHERCLRTTLAALRPEAPMIPPPGCVLAPVKNRPSSGPLY